MIITLAKGRAKYQVENDSRQYILKKWRTPEDKKPYWEIVGFYVSITPLAKRLVKEAMITLPEYKNLTQAVTDASNLITEAIEKEGL
jgi:hypothetical protein